MALHTSLRTIDKEPKLSLDAASQAWELEPGQFSVKKGRFFDEALLPFSRKNAIPVFL